MSDGIDEQDIAPLLSAFADGELDAAQRARVLRHLAERPDALVMMEREQQLRAAARRAILSATPPTPESLRNAVVRSAFATASAASDLPSPGAQGIARRGRWRPMLWAGSVAAGMVLSVVAFNALRPAAPSPVEPPVVAAVEWPIEASVVTLVKKDHVYCSQLAIARHSEPFPARLGELANALKIDLQSNQPTPDLSALGYAWQGTGKCEPPESQVVHILYRSTGPDPTQTISLFVEPFANDVDITAGSLHLLAGDSATPILMWRSEKVLYFLAANDLKTVSAARDAIVRTRG